MTEALPLLAFQAALLFCRLGACGMVLPGLGEAELPTSVRLALPLALVPVLLPVVGPSLPPPPDGAAEALRLVATEVAIGLWLGWLARLVFLALAMAGQAAAFLVGLASVLVADAGIGGGSPLSRFLGLAGIAMLFTTGLYALPLRALAESYAVLPAGAPLAAGPAAEALNAALAESLALALRLTAPFVALSLLVQLGAGLLGRIAPQAQAFLLAAPAQTLLGVLLLAALLPALLAHWIEATRAAWQQLPGLG